MRLTFHKLFALLSHRSPARCVRRVAAPLLVLAALLCISATPAYAGDFYFRLELLDGGKKLVRKWNITIQAADQIGADKEAGARFKKVRDAVCVFSPAYCKKPYRWELYRAVKVTTTTCVELSTDDSTSPTLVCVEGEELESDGAPIDTYEGDDPTPSSALEGTSDGSGDVLQLDLGF